MERNAHRKKAACRNRSRRAPSGSAPECASKQSRTSEVLSNRQKARHLRMAERSFLAVFAFTDASTTPPTSRTSAASMPGSLGHSAYREVSLMSTSSSEESRAACAAEGAGRDDAPRAGGTT